MDDSKLNRVAEDAKIEIIHQIDSFIEKMKSGTENADSFITMSDIEKEWTLLRLNTTKMYSDIVSSYLTAIDEKDLIKIKKENTKERGSGSKHING